MKKEVKLLILFFFLFLFINYSSIDSYLVKTFQNYETGVVERIIDGDTIEINGTSVRLLGINSPEKGEPYSIEAKNFLEKEILNKTVEIHFGNDKFDLYGRKLAYIVYKNKNINLESVREGYSNYYFPSGKDGNYKKFYEAWVECLKKNQNLCAHSKNNCIILKKWDIKNQRVVLENVCEENINLEGWTIKDEGRKKYTFENQILKPEETIVITSEDFSEIYVWTNSGDSIFIRDKENKLVIFESY